jgi:hydroxymethylpyrimidine/phosphomethylpyrimidine kinase
VRKTSKKQERGSGPFADVGPVPGAATDSGDASVRVLLVGGFEPSGRVGLLADVATVHALGARSAAVPTSLTAQGGKRYQTEPVSPKLLDAQLDAAVATGPIHAMKIGVVPGRRSLDVISWWVEQLKVPTVVDPVTRTSRGEPLSLLKPREYRLLAGDHAVLTPNVDELEVATAGGFSRYVVKSMLPGSDSVVDEGEVTLLRGTLLPRDRVHHRGTGCRFASALAVALARGDSIVAAARAARRYVRKFLSTPVFAQVPAADLRWRRPP